MLATTKAYNVLAQQVSELECEVEVLKAIVNSLTEEQIGHKRRLDIQLDRITNADGQLEFLNEASDQQEVQLNELAGHVDGIHLSLNNFLDHFNVGSPDPMPPEADWIPQDRSFTEDAPVKLKKPRTKKATTQKSTRGVKSSKKAAVKRAR